MSFFLATCVLGLHLFSSEVFFLFPLHSRVASFFIGDFFCTPCVLGLPFFIGDLSFQPLAFWGCLFFHRGSFFWAHCIFGLALFSSEVFFWANEWRLQWCTFVHGFGLPGVTALVKYRAGVASDFDSGISVLGKEAYITSLGLHVLHLIKNLTPSRASPIRKRVRALRK
jgi:hypothetical protein